MRDTYDHVARLLDSIETQRDLLNNTLDIYLSSVANRTNDVMKVLTVLGTIALPSIAISGIYADEISKGFPLKTPLMARASWVSWSSSAPPCCSISCDACDGFSYQRTSSTGVTWLRQILFAEHPVAD